MMANAVMLLILLFIPVPPARHELESSGLCRGTGVGQLEVYV